MPEPNGKSSWTLPLVAIGVFASGSLVFNVLSTGFLEADGITHYLYARWAVAEPHLLVNVWGRPVVTMLHALPAQLPGTFLGLPLGLIGVRAMSMLIAAMTALLAWRIATRQGALNGHDRPGLVVPFLLFSPLVFLHSISELTELPFAMLAMLALLGYQRKWWWLLALAAGLSPAARPEGFGLILMAAAGLILHRRWEIVLLPLPLMAWDRLGWWFYGGTGNGQGPWWAVMTWLQKEWPYSEESVYAAGPLLKFIGMLPAATGPMLLPFVLIGTVASITACGKGQLESLRAFVPSCLRAFRGEHSVRVGGVIAFVPWFVLIVHSYLHWTGKMASSGDVRYLIAVTPFWALLAARGFDAVWRAMAWRDAVLWGVLLAAVPSVGVQLYYPVVPLELDRPGHDAVAVAEWYRESEFSRTHAHLVTDHPIVWYHLDLNPQSGGGGKQTIRTARPGSLFLWHEVYSQYNADEKYVVPPDMPLEHGWQEITPPDLPDGWRVFATEPEN